MGAVLCGHMHPITNYPTSLYYKAFGPLLPRAEWKTVDITQLYRDWKNGIYPNYGIQLTPTATNQTNGAFLSSDHPDPETRPKLVIWPCPADFNQDGGVDGQDVEAFFVNWQTSEPPADVNRDGGIDGADVEAFFLAWEAGGCDPR